MADYQYVRQNGFPYGLMTSQDDGGSHTQDPNTNRQGNYRRNLLNTGLSLTYKGRGYDFNSTTTYQYLKDYMLMDIDYLPEDLSTMTYVPHGMQGTVTNLRNLERKGIHNRHL